MTPPSPLIVFSHLRWDFVFQRPQHLMTRIASSRPVFFVEEPIYDPGNQPHWELTSPIKNITVCRPHSPVEKSGFSEEQVPVLAQLVRQLIREHASETYDFWFYTPMALPIAEGFTPGLVVYDCMDELSAFKNATPELLSLEVDLLKNATVVFTGGPSLYQAKRDRHANVHCFPSSVDVSHFSAVVPEPALQEKIPHPRLGFFGVIDERFDLDLLAACADARPEWHFVLVGPVVKIDPATLPHAENIHYMGQQAYADLPAYLGGWDVALLPFARNEATRYISPTKTLEYMAAGKPIVSTPITDVAVPYGNVVRLASDPDSFVAECEKSLAETDSERAKRLARYDQILAGTSWNRTAAEMESVMRKNGQGGSRSIVEPVVDHSSDDEIPYYREVIIGSGPTGLSAAYHLGEGSLLIEANNSVGGWCRSIMDQGFTFDYAGHIMFSNDPYVHELYGKLLGDNVHWQDREAWVYSKNVFTRYPFQGALYGLPADVITECIVGAVEARYGNQPGPAKTNHPQEKARLNGKVKAVCATVGGNDPKDLTDCCGDGIAESTLQVRESDVAPPSAAPKNFEEFIYKVWGKGIAKHFAIPYNRKIWAVPLDQMETSWLGGRVPMPDLAEMIEGALTPKPKPMGPNARFGYPLRGGFQSLMEGFLPLLDGELRLNTKVVGVSAARHILQLSDGTEVSYDKLISTMPLPLLIKALGDAVPKDVRRAAAGLRHTSVRCVNIGIGREALTEKHWIYYPEETVFHRIFVQGNASPHCNPPGGFGLTCEITYGPLKPLPCDGQDLIDRCIADCIKVGLFNADDPILCANQVDMPFAYVVYDHNRADNVELVRDWLLTHDIHLAGRYSEWEYYNSDHAFLAGRTVANAVRSKTLESTTTQNSGV